MLVSTKGRYAMRLMLDVCRHREDGVVSLREVSEREDISLKYLEQLARSLVHANLLQSTRGKGGGYRLGKDPHDIVVGDVLRAAEGTTAPVACASLEGEEACPRSAECAMLGFWSGLDAVIEEYVDGVTLADLAKC
ncbi:MAG: Rrf2 family transcriptional regulator [Eggerthellaceae bacterium]|nr:Rrf2 family transcriptional regulator [Eggerthellaceae bacterium]